MVKAVAVNPTVGYMPLLLGTIELVCARTKEDAIDILKMPLRGDASIILAHHLIAAKLRRRSTPRLLHRLR